MMEILVAPRLGEASGDCPALVESGAVACAHVLRALSLPGQVNVRAQIPLAVSLLRSALLGSGALVLPRGGPKFKTCWVAFWCKFPWFLVAPCSLLP